MKVDLPKQSNYEVALANAWDALSRRSEGELAQLGARKAAGEGRWRMSVLEGEFEVDVEKRRMTLAGRAGADGGGDVSLVWQILALHYLAAEVPVPAARREIAFEDIPSARGYAGPYNARVIKRFCCTAGRDRGKFEAAAKALGGRTVEGGDLAYELRVFPLAPLTIVWYAGDEELQPGASFIYEDNVASLLDVEDIVVMAERVVSRLGGKPW